MTHSSLFRLVRELEKKFSGKHVVFIAQRRILPKPTRKANKLKQKRPISRTLVAVHTAILDDLVSLNLNLIQNQLSPIFFVYLASNVYSTDVGNLKLLV